MRRSSSRLEYVLLCFVTLRPLLAIHLKKQAGDAVNDRREKLVVVEGTHGQVDPVERERKFALSNTLDDTDVHARIHTYVDLCTAL